MGCKCSFYKGYRFSDRYSIFWDIVKDAIIRYKKAGKQFNTVALLRPTSPLRTAQDIIAGYNKFEEKDANAVVAVCEVDHSPLWMDFRIAEILMDFVYDI